MVSTEKKIILNFLKKNVLATISTVESKTLHPESALVAFAELDTLEIIFLTREESRKYKNLEKNGYVALVVGWDPHPSRWVTLQYEGIATQIKESEYDTYRHIFSKKENTPCSEEFLLDPLMKFFKVKPTWIGFSDFTGKKPYVIEMTEF